MKPAHVAKMLNVDPKTIVGWTDHELLRDFFSSNAGAAKSHQRDYTEGDVVLLNTIRVERQLNKSWEDIAETLRAGRLNRDLPPAALLVKSVVPAAHYERFLALMNERDAAIKESERLAQEISQRDAQLEKKDATINALQQEIRRLDREIGRLEGKLESQQDNDSHPA